MTRFLLSISKQHADAAEGFDEVFLWTRSDKGTFSGVLDPHLTALGPVRQENVDFVRLALAVFAADRSVLRAQRGSDWNARDLDVTVELGNPLPWAAVRDDLSRVVNFLTGDRWKFNFTLAEPHSADVMPLDEPVAASTVLLSGGADSAAGALLSALGLPNESNQLLVSHFSSNAISPTQKGLVKRINSLAPQQHSLHRQANLNRTSRRLIGTAFPNESSSRSRSLLFLSLGLASAERAGTPLLIPENGFASLNPPLGPERRGALSTHTTHPFFLAELQTLLGATGAHGVIENPFEEMTKGEMFAEVASRIGKQAASEFLSATNSCSHTDARYSGGTSGSSCGVCFGCVVRRASFRAAGISDNTQYLSDEPAQRFRDFVDGKSVVDAMTDFVVDDPKMSVVLQMSLPASYGATNALDLCRRGVQELRAYLS